MYFTSLDHVFQQEWDSFLKDVDNSVDGDSSDTVKLTEAGPVDIPLSDARNSCQTSLSDYLIGGQSLILILLRHFA